MSFPAKRSRPGRLVAATACPGRHETPGTHLGRPPRPRTAASQSVRSRSAASGRRGGGGSVRSHPAATARTPGDPQSIRSRIGAVRPWRNGPNPSRRTPPCAGPDPRLASSDRSAESKLTQYSLNCKKLSCSRLRWLAKGCRHRSQAGSPGTPGGAGRRRGHPAVAGPLRLCEPSVLCRPEGYKGQPGYAAVLVLRSRFARRGRGCGSRCTGALEIACTRRSLQVRPSRTRAGRPRVTAVAISTPCRITP